MSNTHFSDAKRARVKAARRQRRVIFNDDSAELYRDDGGTPDGFLKRRIRPLADTHVDSIAYSVLCLDEPAYNSKIQPMFDDADGNPSWGGTARALSANYGPNLAALSAAGHCPLQIITDFAHEHGMESFASMRMNDVHDSFIVEGHATWKKEHPELLVDTTGVLPEFELYVTANDFVHEEVRQRKLAIIEEIAQRYDVDGFELDYIRHPVLFSRRMRGEPCTRDEIDIINAFMREIRRITDGAAGRRGRPMLIAVRVPDTFAKCLDNGMDLHAWLEQDLADILIAGGGYAPFSLPVEEFVGAARPHGVRVYPCINQGIVCSVSAGDFLESVRGLASNWHRAGADGIYVWNLGSPIDFMSDDELVETRSRFYACLTELGDPRAWEAKAKLFCVDSAAENSVLAYYAHVTSRWPLPLRSKEGMIRRGVIGRVPIIVGDDFQEHAPSTATVTIEFDDPAWKDILEFRLNGSDLIRGTFVPPSHGQCVYALCYTVNSPPVRRGRNFLEVATKDQPPPDEIVEITGIALRIEYDT